MDTDLVRDVRLHVIRTAFAKENGLKAALYSANSTGACQNCNGAGVIYTDLAMMAAVATVCEECGGKRFQAQVLEYRLQGKNIAELLAMSAAEAEEFLVQARRTPSCTGWLRSASGMSASASR